MFLKILAPLVGVAGAALLSYAGWLVFVPLGYASAGALCLFWSWLAARAGVQGGK
jgi:hypothetical protein